METSMPIPSTRKKTRQLDRETRLHQTWITVMDNQPVRASEVARYMEVNPVTARRYLKQLEALGRIRRVMTYYWQT